MPALRKMSDVDIIDKARSLGIRPDIGNPKIKEMTLRRIWVATRPPRKTIAKHLEGGCPKIKRIIEHKIEMGGGKSIREEVGECDICGHKLKRALETETQGMIGYDCYLNLCGIQRPSGQLSFKDLPKETFEQAGKGFVEDLKKLSKEELIKAATSETAYKEGKIVLVPTTNISNVKVISPIDVSYKVESGRRAGETIYWNALIDRGIPFRMIMKMEPKLLEKLISTKAVNDYFRETRKELIEMK